MTRDPRLRAAAHQRIELTGALDAPVSSFFLVRARVKNKFEGPPGSGADIGLEIDTNAGYDASTLHPRWIGLGRVALPSEPMTLTGELAGALAARRVATDDDAVVFYMLESK